MTDMDVKAISTASDYVHVRRKPNTHSKIVGRLYRGCSADVLKTKNGWAKIRSGNVTGYIKKSYLAIGDDAKKMIGKYGQKYVRVKTSVVTLNVRKKADIKSKILTQIPIEENYDVIKSTDHWYKIEIDGDTKGYVRKEYVTLHVRFKHAKSMAEIKAERRRKLAAKRAQTETCRSCSFPFYQKCKQQFIIKKQLKQTFYFIKKQLQLTEELKQLIIKQ